MTSELLCTLLYGKKPCFHNSGCCAGALVTGVVCWVVRSCALSVGWLCAGLCVGHVHGGCAKEYRLHPTPTTANGCVHRIVQPTALTELAHFRVAQRLGGCADLLGSFFPDNTLPVPCLSLSVDAVTGVLRILRFCLCQYCLHHFRDSYGILCVCGHSFCKPLCACRYSLRRSRTLACAGGHLPPGDSSIMIP